jgi:hypothetical protein
MMAIMQKLVYALPKPLYVIADINAPMAFNPIQVYAIQSGPNYLVHQGTQYVPNHSFGSGAIDMTIDSESQTLFITYENTKIIQLTNATTFMNLGTTTVPDANNLAGIVYDHDKKLIYTVDRLAHDLYILHWDPVAHMLTFESHVDLNYTTRAYGIALDEINGILYVADGVDSRKFDWYDTDTWAHLGTKTTTHPVVGIAVDAMKGLVYTSGGARAYTGGGENSYGLYKYHIATDTETAVLNYASGIYAGVLGVAVDQNSSLVYVTTYGDGSAGYTDVLIVFDSNLNELWKSGDIGNPTGIAIPLREFSYDPPSSNLEYWILATLGLVGCSATFVVFLIFKRRKRNIYKLENVQQIFLS